MDKFEIIVQTPGAKLNYCEFMIIIKCELKKLKTLM
jgi:hypothetical protein